jgi:glycosyltransferase involved in cell wall biosynthesis
MPGSLGRFIDSLAQFCENVMCFMRSPRLDEFDRMDYRIVSPNVCLVDIGLYVSTIQRTLLARHYTAHLRRHASEMDLLLVRGPSPLLPAMVFASPVPTALLLVGDYLAGIDDLPQPRWRKEAIRLWSYWNKWGQNRAARRSLTFVNSRVLYRELDGRIPHLHEVRTTTLTGDDFFERDDTCKKRPVRMLYAGRMDRTKGLLQMTEALANLRENGEDVVLDLVGWVERGDPILEEVQSLAYERGVADALHYAGPRPLGPELFAFYRQADIFLTASLASEGFPRAIWEAMAHSLPVVATSVGSIPDYAEGAAVLVEPRNVPALAGAIQKVIQDSKLRRGLILSGRERALQNTLEDRSQEIMEHLIAYNAKQKGKKVAGSIKVLHVAPLPPPLGGMVTYFQGLLDSDVFKSVDFRVVRLSYFNKEKYEGIIRFAANCINSIILTANFLVNLVLWQPDIVHIQSNSGFGFFEKSWIALLAKIFCKKTIFHFHGGYMREWYNHSSPFVQKVIKKCALVNDRIMTGSPQMRETWLSIGVPPGKVVYVGNAVNLPRDIVRKPQGQVSILFLTRVTVEKGVIELIDAFLALRKTFRDISLRIVGTDTKDTPYVRNYLASNDRGCLIEYVGPVSDEQKRQEYMRADIFAFPTYFEDQSYAVMEAMSYGLAVVASNVGGVPSLIEDGRNGLLVLPKDVESLRNALEAVITNTRKRRDLGMNARKTIEMGFTWDVRSQEIVMLYQSILEKDRNSAT